MRVLAVSLFITLCNVGFSQYRVLINKNISAESITLKFIYDDYGKLEFLQNDKVVQSIDFQGTKMFSFKRFEKYDKFGFCDLKNGVQVIFYEENKKPRCDIKEFPVM